MSNLQPYIAFVNRTCCYHPSTSTAILQNHKCQLYSAAKIRTLVEEFITERNKECDFQTKTSDCNQMELAIMLLTIASKLPGYARVGAGMLICSLSQYLTVEEWECQLDYIAEKQDDKLLWTESFLRICILLRGNPTPTADANKIIEAEAEKQIPMYNGKLVEVTFID